MATERVIDLTEQEVLEANLKALGINPTQGLEERILDAFENLIREKGRFVSGSEVAREIGEKANTINAACARMVLRGQMILVERGLRGKNCYIPRVV